MNSIHKCLGLILMIAVTWSSGARSAQITSLGPPPAMNGYIENQSYLYPNNFSGGSITNGNTTIGAYYASGEGAVSLDKNTGVVCCEGLVDAGMQLVSPFEVVGPTSTSVSLVLSATGSTSESSSAYAQASVDIEDPLAGALSNVGASACSWSYYQCSSPTAPSSFSVNQGFTVTTNKVYWVRMSVGAYGDAGVSGPVLYNAVVDPNVTFDPSFNSAGFSLVYGSDVAPLPTPLPAAAWLLVSGLGGIGFLGHKRNTIGASRTSRA
jgi:hypothetical protein